MAEASGVLEVSHYVLAVGSSDITDLLVNIAGGLAGGALAAQARRRLPARTAAVMTRACSIGTVVALLAVGAFVASPLRYGSPRRAAAVPTHTDRGLDVGGRILLDHANPVAHLHARPGTLVAPDARSLTHA